MFPLVPHRLPRARTPGDVVGSAHGERVDIGLGATIRRGGGRRQPDCGLADLLGADAPREKYRWASVRALRYIWSGQGL